MQKIAHHGIPLRSTIKAKRKDLNFIISVNAWRNVVSETGVNALHQAAQKYLNCSIAKCVIFALVSIVIIP